jgi:hypothetical protein
MSYSSSGFFDSVRSLLKPRRSLTRLGRPCGQVPDGRRRPGFIGFHHFGVGFRSLSSGCGLAGSGRWNFGAVRRLSDQVTRKPTRELNLYIVKIEPPPPLTRTTPRCIWNHPHCEVLSCGSLSRRPPSVARYGLVDVPWDTPAARPCPWHSVDIPLVAPCIHGPQQQPQLCEIQKFYTISLI